MLLRQRSGILGLNIQQNDEFFVCGGEHGESELLGLQEVR